MKRLAFYLLFAWILTGCAETAASQHLYPEEFNPVAPTHAAATATQTATPSRTPTTTTEPTLEPTLESSPTPRPAPTATPSAYAYGPAYFPDHISPLTGLPVADPDLLNRRPMAIKVTHFPRTVRPQWGLSLADHVIEYLIGDHMTRFIAIFYGTDASQVGPVRSARLFDEQVMRMYKSILVFGGADEPIMERLTQPDIRNHLVLERPDNCPPLCRLDSGHGYNNLFVDIQSLSQYITERGTSNERQDLDGLRFEMEVPRSGHPGVELSVRFSSVSYHQWIYDSARRRYLRFQEIEDDRGQEKSYAPLLDSLTGEQIAADNVVVLRSPQQIFYQSTSTTIYDMTFEGPGTGYGLRDGQIYPLNWARPGSDKIINLFLPNGRSYPLKPGNVWFVIIGETSGFEPDGEGAWNISFAIP